MDQTELRSGKALKNGNLRKDSDNDSEADVQRQLEEGYAVGGNEKEKEIHPRRIDNIHDPHPPPFPTMDISSVRRPTSSTYPPTSVMTPADQTSARGLPRSLVEPLKSGRFNNRTPSPRNKNLLQLTYYNYG